MIAKFFLILMWVGIGLLFLHVITVTKTVPHQQCSELFNPSNSTENLDMYNHCLSYPQTYNVTQYTVYEEWTGANK